jgi:three-Cys-motif partner protein
LEGIEDAKAIVEGSALRAIGLEREFGRYVFIEKDRRKLDELRELITNKTHPSRRIEFVCGDANVEIEKLCPHLKKPNVRAVVFLDPFGSQVGWSTLKSLAQTGHVDLWYLFPAGLSVNRQISSDGRRTIEQEKSLDRLFGPHNWRSRLVTKEIAIDLFGSIEKVTKSATIDDITRYMIECMKSIFAGDVRTEWLPLGRDGSHWYSLLFAMANSEKSAKKIGHDIARHIMTNQ